MADDPADKPDEITLTLDTYERDNLLALLHAIFRLSALPTANTGDWLGQIYWKLAPRGFNPAVHKPNVSPMNMAFGYPPKQDK
jgi:hypothetical protein